MVKKSFLILILTIILNNNTNCMSLEESIPLEEICIADVYDSFDPTVYEQDNPTWTRLIFTGDVGYKNSAGITILMSAAAKGFFKAVKVICERASYDFITQTDETGLHVLDHAIINRRQDIVDYLRSLSVNWDN